MGSRPQLSRLTPFERLLSLFTSVRPGEGRCVFLLFIGGFLLMFAYYMLKPVREALILTEGDAELRAYSVAIVAVTLVFLVPLYKQLFEGLADPRNKSRILRWVLAFFMSNLVIFYALGQAGVRLGVAYFVWLSVFNVTVLAQFWAFAADLFNTKAGQRLFPVIMVGLSLGAWVGANAAGTAFEFMGAYPIMLAALVVLMAPLGISILVERSVPGGSESVDGSAPRQKAPGFQAMIGGFDTVFRSRYLVMVALLMFLINMINTTGEFILSDFLKRWAVEQVSIDPGLQQERLIGRFMSSYYAWISLLSLLIQLLFVARAIRYFGIRGVLLVLPLFMILHYGLLAVLPLFVFVRGLMIGENAINYSLQNTINQALYLPLTREQKYVGKTTIDTFFVRFGDLSQAGLVFLGLNVLGWGPYGFIVTNGVMALLLLVVALDIRRSHRAVMRSKLMNLPPKIVAPLPDIHAPAGRLMMFSVPDECFFDPDPGDTLDYEARLAHGGSLPGWLRFDRHNQTFTLRPPAGEAGSVTIELIASDFEGLSAQASFTLRYAPPDATPIETAAPPAARSGD